MIWWTLFTEEVSHSKYNLLGMMINHDQPLAVFKWLGHDPDPPMNPLVYYAMLTYTML